MEEQQVGGESGGFADNFYVIPEGLDFMNSTLIVGVLVLVCFELFYLCLPRIGQR